MTTLDTNLPQIITIFSNPEEKFLKDQTFSFTDITQKNIITLDNSSYSETRQLNTLDPNDNNNNPISIHSNNKNNNNYHKNFDYLKLIQPDHQNKIGICVLYVLENRYQSRKYLCKFVLNALNNYFLEDYGSVGLKEKMGVTTLKQVKKNILMQVKSNKQNLPLYINIINEYQKEHLKHGTFQIYQSVLRDIIYENKSMLEFETSEVSKHIDLTNKIQVKSIMKQGIALLLLQHSYYPEFKNINEIWNSLFTEQDLLIPSKRLKQSYLKDAISQKGIKGKLAFFSIKEIPQQKSHDNQIKNLSESSTISLETIYYFENDENNFDFKDTHHFNINENINHNIINNNNNYNNLNMDNDNLNINNHSHSNHNISNNNNIICNINNNSSNNIMNRDINFGQPVIIQPIMNYDIQESYHGNMNDYYNQDYNNYYHHHNQYLNMQQLHQPTNCALINNSEIKLIDQQNYCLNDNMALNYDYCLNQSNQQRDTQQEYPYTQELSKLHSSQQSSSSPSSSSDSSSSSDYSSIN